MKLEGVQPISIENYSEMPHTQIEYTYKDTVGQVLGKNTQRDWLLSESLDMSYCFDGLVETEYGQFMMECTVATARRVIAKIKKYVETKKELEKLEASLQDLTQQERILLASFRSNPNKYEKEFLSVSTQRQQVMNGVSLKRNLAKAFEEELQEYRM